MQASIWSRSEWVMQNIAKWGPKAVDNPELAVRDELLLGLAISRWEEHVARERNDIGLRLDPTECGRKVACDG